VRRNSGFGFRFKPFHRFFLLATDWRLAGISAGSTFHEIASHKSRTGTDRFEFTQQVFLRVENRRAGSRASRAISDLNTIEPFGVGAVTLHALPAAEKVTVLAGAHVRINRDIDDMDAHVQATYWWRLRKMQIGVG
jgi:fido (protein-threonine AMPylation protein)